MKDIRTEAVKKHNFKTPKTLFALVFRHSNGWTFLEFTKTVAEAHARRKEIDLPRAGFEFKIIPYTLIPKIKDPTLI